MACHTGERDLPINPDLYIKRRDGSSYARLKKMDVRAKKEKIRDRVSLLQGTLKKIEACSGRIVGKEREMFTKPLSDVLAKVQKIKGAISRVNLQVVFFGKTSNGKSTVINALLGDAVCPTGYGSVTGCFCSIENGPRGDTGNCYRVVDVSSHGIPDDPLESDVDGFVNVDKFHSLEQSASFFGDNCLPPSSMICVQLGWPEERCPLLVEDVVIIDTPGLDAEAMIDEYMTKVCSDADVFVYVCDGKRTLEGKEMIFLKQVRDVLSNLTCNNLFIAVNWWDLVCEGGKEERVRKQHMDKAETFLTEEFKFEKESVPERMFFISGKEALEASKSKPSDFTGSKKTRQDSFLKFKADLKSCLTEYGLQTRFGRHCDSITASMKTMAKYLNKVEAKAQKQKTDLTKDLASLQSRVAKLEEASKTLENEVKDQTEDNSVAKVFKRVGEKIDRAIAGAKEKVSERVKVCKVEYRQGRLEVFKARLLADVQASYDRINSDLNRELDEVYSQAESKLADVISRCMPEMNTVRRRPTHSLDNPDLLRIGNVSVSSFESSAVKQLMPKSMVEAAAVVVPVGAVAVVVPVGAAVTGIIAVCVVVVPLSGYAMYKVYRIFWTDDMKDEAKSQVVTQLHAELDDVKKMKEGFGNRFQQKLKEKNVAYQTTLQGQLDALQIDVHRKEKALTNTEKEILLLQELKEEVVKAEKWFCQFRTNDLTAYRPYEFCD